MLVVPLGEIVVIMFRLLAHDPLNRGDFDAAHDSVGKCLPNLNKARLRMLWALQSAYENPYMRDETTSCTKSR